MSSFWRLWLPKSLTLKVIGSCLLCVFKWYYIPYLLLVMCCVPGSGWPGSRGHASQSTVNSDRFAEHLTLNERRCQTNGTFKNHGPKCKPEIVGPLLQGHPHKGPPIYGNSQMRCSFYSLQASEPGLAPPHLAAFSVLQTRSTTRGQKDQPSE